MIQVKNREKLDFFGWIFIRKLDHSYGITNLICLRRSWVLKGSQIRKH